MEDPLLDPLQGNQVDILPENYTHDCQSYNLLAPGAGGYVFLSSQGMLPTSLGGLELAARGICLNQNAPDLGAMITLEQTGAKASYLVPDAGPTIALAAAPPEAKLSFGLASIALNATGITLQMGPGASIQMNAGGIVLTAGGVTLNLAAAALAGTAPTIALNSTAMPIQVGTQVMTP